MYQLRTDIAAQPDCPWVPFVCPGQDIRKHKHGAGHGSWGGAAASLERCKQLRSLTGSENRVLLPIVLRQLTEGGRRSTGSDSE
ncbi:hypothetical protein J6590_028628 [Homalodisca vitripennis]|nr:hypothetical protein J6590_028628 [Homalodisca vitripennis]